MGLNNGVNIFVTKLLNMNEAFVASHTSAVELMMGNKGDSQEVGMLVSLKSLMSLSKRQAYALPDKEQTAEVCDATGGSMKYKSWQHRTKNTKNRT